jgi:hypothetical protein
MTWPAQHQRLPHGILEFLQLHAHSGLRAIDLLRGSRERSRIGDGDKRAQPVKL